MGKKLLRISNIQFQRKLGLKKSGDAHLFIGFNLKVVQWEKVLLKIEF